MKNSGEYGNLIIREMVSEQSGVGWWDAYAKGGLYHVGGVFVVFMDGGDLDVGCGGREIKEIQNCIENMPDVQGNINRDTLLVVCKPSTVEESGAN